MRLGIITGNHPRHIALVNEICKWKKPLGQVEVVREDMIPEPPQELTPGLATLWERHFNTREESEALFFGWPEMSYTNSICVVEQGHLNSKIVEEFVADMQFDCVLISGVDIIKEPLFSLLPKWKINLHMGLIPHYKGSITTFWPMYMLKPHWIGCTYHVIAPEVDAGEILHQVVPELAYGDGLHDVSCKALLAAYADVGKVLKYAEDCIQSGREPKLDLTLAKKGKIFTKRDWHAGQLRLIYGLYQDRIVDAYLSGDIPQTPGPRLVTLT